MFVLNSYNNTTSVKVGHAMELRQIYTFIKIAQLGSFSKAAEQLGYSQSAATVQIKILEEELGTRLFDRVGKRVTLTHQGEMFMKHADIMVKEVMLAKEDLKITKELTGSLRIGTVESLCFSKFPTVLKYFYHHHPGVSVQLVTGSPEGLVDMMGHNQVDIIYVLDKQMYHSSWVKALEMKEEIVFVSSADSPFAKGGSVRLDDILQEKFFLTEHDANYRKELDNMLAARKQYITPFLEISNTEFIIKLVKEGMGLSFLPRFSVEEGITQHQLAVVKTEDFNMSMWRQVIYHKDKWVTPEMTEFISLAQHGML